MDLYNASQGNEADDEPIELNLEQYEEAKAHYQGIIDRADAARRLANNDDFKALVLTGYFENEPKRLVELMASGKLPQQSMDNCVKDIESVGRFRNYMKMHMEQGRMAADELVLLEEARDEAILQEEAALAGE